MSLIPSEITKIIDECSKVESNVLLPRSSKGTRYSAGRDRAVSEETIKNMWIFNQRFSPDPTNKSSKATRMKANENGERPWGAWRARCMMQLAYAIAFMCFLRVDEVLRIQLSDFTWEDDSTGRLRLHLPYRKAARIGQTEDFVLYFDEEKTWLDVPHLLLSWLHFSGITDGHLFRPIDAKDRIPQENKQLRTDRFLQNFRTNLEELEVDPTLYGTHSLCRGGVQYFLTEKRWSIRKLCRWGGWSLEDKNPIIVSYIVGPNDDPVHEREDYLHPNARSKASYCTGCNRSCECS